MVLGQEMNFKGQLSTAAGSEMREASIVPRSATRLAGPAAFSYVKGNS